MYLCLFLSLDQGGRASVSYDSGTPKVLNKCLLHE